jgi:hypothetical protein
MNDVVDIECGDRVRFSRTVIRREIGTVVAIDDHIIYGPEGEVCIRVGDIGPRYCLPREAVIEVLDDETVQDGGESL